MGLRITQRIMVDRLLGDLNQQQRRILDLQEQLATNQRVNNPSDDPLAARRGINVRSEIERNEQFLTNISTMSPFLRATETSILTVEDLTQRARQLALQANNNIGGNQAEQLATEVNQLLESLLVQANGSDGGRRLFGGTRTQNEPFAATRNAAGEVSAVTYEGNSEQFQIEISPGIFVNVNEPGDEVFQSNGDLFQTLIDLRDDIRNGVDVGGRITDLQTIERGLLQSIARTGAVQARLERVESNLDEINTQLSEVYSDNIDADFAEVTLNLNVQLNAFQAALNAGARVIQPSLLDFVR